jgi:hypothetical protein
LMFLCADFLIIRKIKYILTFKKKRMIAICAKN